MHHPRFLLAAVAPSFLIALLGCAGQAPLPPKAAQLNAAGVDALQRGDLQTAEARFALALEFHPRFVDALVNLGLVEMQRGNFALARRELDRAVAINRHLAQPHHGLGVLAERESQWDEAAEHYRAALEVDPGFAPSRANLARLYFASDHLDDAREQFLRLVQVAPDDVHGHAGLAESLLRLGRDDEAAEVVAQGLIYLPGAPELLLLQARASLIAGEYAEAQHTLESLTEVPAPVAGAAWSWLGVAHLVQSRNPQAIRCAEHALALDRDDPLATYVLAMALADRGDLNAAGWLDRANALAPRNSVISAARATASHPTPSTR